MNRFNTLFFLSCLLTGSLFLPSEPPKLPKNAPGGGIVRPTAKRGAGVALPTPTCAVGSVSSSTSTTAGAGTLGHGGAFKNTVKKSTLQQQEALFSAVRENDIDQIERLLAAGASINAQEDTALGGTPFILAAGNGDAGIDTAEWLLEHNADVDGTFASGDTTLHSVALGAGDKVAIKWLLGNRANIDAQNKKGLTPLMLAVLKNKIDNVNYLLERNARLDIKDIKGNTALDIAETNKNYQAVALLKAAQQKRKDVSSSRTLSRSVGQADLTTIATGVMSDFDKLLSSTALSSTLSSSAHNVPSQNNEQNNGNDGGMGIFGSLLDGLWHESGNRAETETELLPESFQELRDLPQNEKNKHLASALKKGDENAIALLIKAGADESYKGSDGNTMFALAKQKNIDGVLRKEVAIRDAQKAQERAALKQKNSAKAQQEKEAADQRASEKRKKREEEQQRKAALQQAETDRIAQEKLAVEKARKEKEEVRLKKKREAEEARAKQLLQAKIELELCDELVEEAIRESVSDIATLAFQEASDQHARRLEQEEADSEEVRKKELRLRAELENEIEREQHKKKSEKDSHDNAVVSPNGIASLLCQIAGNTNKFKMLDVLKTKKTELRDQSFNISDTALHVAVSTEGDADMTAINRLLAQGAQVNAQNIFGITPLMYAVMTDQTDAIKAFINHNADQTLKNSWGTTAIDIARAYHKKEALQLLSGTQETVREMSMSPASPASPAPQRNTPGPAKKTQKAYQRSLAEATPDIVRQQMATLRALGPSIGFSSEQLDEFLGVQAQAMKRYNLSDAASMSPVSTPSANTSARSSTSLSTSAMETTTPQTSKTPQTMTSPVSLTVTPSSVPTLSHIVQTTPNYSLDSVGSVPSTPVSQPTRSMSVPVSQSACNMIGFPVTPARSYLPVSSPVPMMQQPILLELPRPEPVHSSASHFGVAGPVDEYDLPEEELQRQLALTRRSIPDSFDFRDGLQDVDTIDKAVCVALWQIDNARLKKGLLQPLSDAAKENYRKQIMEVWDVKQKLRAKLAQLSQQKLSQRNALSPNIEKYVIEKRAIADLIFAVTKGDLPRVKTILACGNKNVLNGTNLQGDSALIVAVTFEHYDIARYLVAQGIDKNIVAENGATASSLAKSIALKNGDTCFWELIDGITKELLMFQQEHEKRKKAEASLANVLKVTGYNPEAIG